MSLNSIEPMSNTGTGNCNNGEGIPNTYGKDRLSGNGQVYHLVLNAPRDEPKKLTGERAEIEVFIKEFRKAFKQGIELLIFQWEKNKGGNWHGHVYVRMSKRQKNANFIPKLDKLVRTWSGSICNNGCAKQVTKNIDTQMSYLYKDRDIHEPVIFDHEFKVSTIEWVLEHLNLDIEESVTNYNKLKEEGEMNKRQVSTSDEDILNLLRKVMVHCGFYLGLVRDSEQNILVCLGESGIRKAHTDEFRIAMMDAGSLRKFNLSYEPKMMQFLTDHVFRKYLPTIELDFYVIRFDDCELDISTCERHPVGTFKYPMTTYDGKIEDVEYPERYVKGVKNLKIAPGRFRRLMSKSFSFKEEGDKVFMLVGKTGVGKTALLLPWVIFHSANTYMLQSMFSLSEVAKILFAFLDEFDPSRPPGGLKIGSTAKEFLEGAEFKTPVKNKQETVVKPTQVVAASNHVYIISELDQHQAATHRRTVQIVIPHDADLPDTSYPEKWRKYVNRELVGIVLWCTKCKWTDIDMEDTPDDDDILERSKYAKRYETLY